MTEPAGPTAIRPDRPSRSVAPIEITFPSTSPFTLTSGGGRAEPIEAVGTLFRPADLAAGGRRPAVVILQGLGGPIAARELAYGAELAARGYVALAVDSFRARGAAGYGHTRRALQVTETMMLADAYGALAWLCDHPAVDRDAVCVIGFSYGGMVAVLAAYEQIRERFAPAGPTFAGHVSYYGCSVARFDRVDTTGAPILMLLGALDENVSVPRSRRIAADLRRGGSDVVVKVFPGACHQWDGDDAVPRKVRFSLRDLELTVRPDGRVVDARLGLPLAGPISRTLLLAARIRTSGYWIHRNDRLRRRSNQELYSFLDRVTGGRRRRPVPGAVA